VNALEGVRVLDLSRLLPGGFCSLLLADFGAEVLKVEDTGMGDYVRWAPPYYEGADDSAKSALYLALNRGKRSVRVNLKEERGREVLLRLVRDYDVLLESFRPGVLDRLRAGRAVPRSLGTRHELPRARRAARADGRARRAAGAGRGADRRRGRRGADGGVRDPRGAARA
jgi:hypothetical protein